MAVTMPREGWTDERLDKRFDRIDADIRELRVEVRRGFEQIDSKLDAMQSETNMRFEAMQSEMNKRFDAMQSETSRRFDAMQSETSKRFEAMNSETTKRFEALRFETTKRFDSLQSESNLRSDAVQRNMTSWFIALFSVIVTCLATGVGALIALT